MRIPETVRKHEGAVLALVGAGVAGIIVVGKLQAASAAAAATASSAGAIPADVLPVSGAGGGGGGATGSLGGDLTTTQASITPAIAGNPIAGTSGGAPTTSAGGDYQASATPGTSSQVPGSAGGSANASPGTSFPIVDPAGAAAAASAMAGLSTADQAYYAAKIGNVPAGAIPDTYNPATLLARWQNQAAAGTAGTAFTAQDITTGLAYAQARAAAAGVTPTQLAAAHAAIAAEAPIGQYVPGKVPYGGSGLANGPAPATQIAELAVNQGKPWTTAQLNWSNAHGGAIPPAGI